MNTPKKFKIFGQTIHVTRDPSEFIDNTSAVGSACYRANTINIRPDLPTYPMPHEIAEQAFWHEFTHFVLHFSDAAKSSEGRPYQDEGFVDLVGSVIHQAINTFEY